MRWQLQFEVALLAVGLCCLPADAAPTAFSSDLERFPPEPSSYERERYQRIAREEQERYRKRVTIPPDALGENVPRFTSARLAGTQAKMAAGLRPVGESAERVRFVISLAAAGILAGLLAFRRLSPRIAAVINTKYNPWALSPSAAGRRVSQVRAEEAAFAEFLAAFRIGQTAVPRTSAGLLPGPAREVSEEALEADLQMECHPVKDSSATAPEQLAALHKLLEEIRWTPNGTTGQRKLLDGFCRQLGALKGQANVPELQPAWQMACALEGLIKQLASKASYVTPSTLRTVGISLDLLGDLCVKGLPSNLATNPPIRLLAVDDDRVTRHALSWSLSKALSQPDLAENGAATLALVAQKPYDVIFLDVQMPGMDGFELCSRIHENALNHVTPVVFVTCQSDFNARAESTLCGGHDLIGKPFLTFEITVIALTLALRRRLQARDRVTDFAEVSLGPELLPPSIDLPTRAQSPLQEELHRREEEAASPEVLRNPQPQSLPPTDRADVAKLPDDTGSAAVASRPGPGLVSSAATRNDSCVPPRPPQNELVKAFFTHAPAHIRAFHDLVQVIRQAEDADARQEMLVDLYLFIHSLTLNAGLAELHPAFQTSAALEGLLKKLLETPGNSTPSTLQTVATAVELLSELCVEGLRADLTTNPPIRMLVVDDDPIARRELAGALQMAFEKPDLAENAAVALAFATQRGYDVVFLDVVMPDMDGFTLCPMIHEAPLNRKTPVVFVTSHSDLRSVMQSSGCGGSDFVTKPFLTAEITLKALVYALRRRLQEIKTAQAPLRQQTKLGKIES